eukprot:140913_1
MSSIAVGKYIISNRLLSRISKAPNQIRVQLQTMSTATTANGQEEIDHPVASSITSKLSSSLSPSFLNVANESHMHNVPKNSETHFKVIVVSQEFDGVPSLVKRHRMINTILAEELEGPVHALSIVAKSPKQWEKMAEKYDGEENIVISPSPNCKGGDGSLPKR